MCGKYSLETQVEKLPKLIQENLSFEHKARYSQRSLIRPTEPIITLLKEEGKTQSSLMLWGLIPSWSKDPFDKESPRPFNARAETVAEKPVFRAAWRHHRCLIPASCFFEKGYRIKPTNKETFWLAGIWDRWVGSDGSELDSCTILTTESNALVKPLHKRMPVIIPEGLEEEWMRNRNRTELRQLEPLLERWNPLNWIAESLEQSDTVDQMTLF